MGEDEARLTSRAVELQRRVEKERRRLDEERAKLETAIEQQ